MIILPDAHSTEYSIKVAPTNWVSIEICHVKCLQRLCADRKVVVEDVAPLVLDVEEEDEDEGHVHGHDGHHH